MLETLTYAVFEPALGERFELCGDAAAAQLELICAEPLASDGHAVRPPFHLIFRGPRAPILDQRTHALTHPAFGTLEIFLVPIGPDRVGQCYEAVFA